MKYKNIFFNALLLSATNMFSLSTLTSPENKKIEEKKSYVDRAKEYYKKYNSPIIKTGKIIGGGILLTTSILASMYWLKIAMGKRFVLWLYIRKYNTMSPQEKIDSFISKVDISSIELIDNLIKLCKPNVNAKNSKGKTALHYVKTANMAQTFITAGAHIEECDHENNTPLMTAAFNGYSDVVQLLLQQGAAINAKNIYKKTALDRALSQQAMCTQPEKEQYQTVITLLETAQETLNIHLIDATKDSDVSKIKNLLNQGANPNTFVDESIPLYYAKTKEVAEALINGGADVNRANTSKLTPLMEAALWGYLEVVKVLLENGAQVDQRDQHGSNALSKAILSVDKEKKNQYVAIIKLLQTTLKAAVITS